MRKIYLLCCLLPYLSCAFSNAQDNEDLFLEQQLKGKEEEELLHCPEEKNSICNAALGYAYIKGFNTGKWTAKQDNKKAEYFLSNSLSYPYSRYLLGKMMLAEVLRYGHGKINTGISLTSSACDENVTNACLVMSSLYEDKYKPITINYLNCEKNKKAIYYTRKAIYSAQKYLNYLNKKGYKEEEKIEKIYFIEYKKKLAYLLIKEKDKQGVDMLESLTIDDVSFDGFLLAEIYEEGKIVPQDLVKAYMYYDLRGGDNQEGEQRLRNKMTPAQIKEAVQRSWQWQEHHHSYRPGYRSPEDYDF